MIVRDIYCFHRDIGDKNLSDTVPLWKSIWAKHGWTPHVLGMEDAKRHPKFRAVFAKAESFPTVNHRDYSTANFVRWCAFSQINGAVCDYDVLPRIPYPPREYPGFYNAEFYCSPGFVVGKCTDFEKIVQAILDYEQRPYDIAQGKPHVCDMKVVQHSRHLFDTIGSEVINYGWSGWQKAALVHCGNCYIRHDVPKTEAIKEILKGEGAIYE